jgi:t-SNARE complex subunit (syntaxin)
MLDNDTHIMSVAGHRKNRKACLTVILAGIALPIIVFVVGTIIGSCGS